MPARPGIGAGPSAFGGAGNGGFGGDDDFGAPATRTPSGREMSAASPAITNGGTGPNSTSGGPGSTGPFPALGGTSTSGPSPSVGVRGGSDGSQVTIPPSVSPAQDQRLPIFDSLESDWFRRSGKGLSQTGTSGPATGAPSDSWRNSPADEGWRAAQVVASPAVDETTTAGLPKRVPRANLVPGSVGGGEASSTEAAPPARTADDVRTRMASFQRGVREARAAAPQNEEP
jgi:hypothetical protein